MVVALGVDNDGAVSIPISIFGGGAAGIACGILLGRRVGQTPIEKIVLGLVLSSSHGAGFIFLCFIGCSMGGWQLNLR